MLVTAVITAIHPAAADTRRPTDFDSQRAISLILTADKPAEFENAARALNQLIERGARNAPLFYNFGVMALLAGYPRPALEAFIRAERYSGTTWELKHNMLLAISKIEDAPTSPHLPWYRVPLFWHYGLAGRTRMTIASAAFLLLCIALLLRGLNAAHRIQRLIFIPALATLVIFGSSAATTIYQENHTHQLVLIHE
jgi:hypothetical protein